MSSFATFVAGIVLVIVGLSIGAYLVEVPPLWILVGAIVGLGGGVVMATLRTKPRDPPT